MALQRTSYSDGGILIDRVDENITAKLNIGTAQNSPLDVEIRGNLTSGGNVTVGGNLSVSGTVTGILDAIEPAEIRPFYKTTTDKLPDSISMESIETWMDASISENVVLTSGSVSKVWNRAGQGSDWDWYDNTTTGMTYDPNLKMIRFSDLGKCRLQCNTSSYFNTTGCNYTATWVVLPEPQTTNPDTIKYVGVPTNPNGNGNSCFMLNRNSFNTYGNAASTSKATFPQSDTTQVLNKKHIITFVVTGGTSSSITRMYYNGLYCSEANDTPNTRSNLAYLGSGGSATPETAGTGRQWNGYIGEHIIFKKALSESELLDLHNYLNNKWNVYSRGTVDVFVVAGQSNALGNGTGNTRSSPYGKFLDGNYFYTSEETPIAYMQDPVGNVQYRKNGQNRNANLTRNASVPTAGSAWPSFCYQYYLSTGVEPMIVQAAVGGTSLFSSSAWSPYPPGSNTNYCNDVIRCLPLAVQKLEAAGYKVNNKCVIWHQGESDRTQTKEAYQTRFLALIDLFLQNGYDKFLYYEISEMKSTGAADYHDIADVRSAQREVQHLRKNTHMLFSCHNFAANRQDYMESDDLHYNSTGLIAMGTQGAISAADILYKNPTYTTQNLSISNVLKVPRLSMPVSTKTSSFTLNEYDNSIIYANTTSGNITVTFPAGLPEGTRFMIVKALATNNLVITTDNGVTVNGAAKSAVTVNTGLRGWLDCILYAPNTWSVISNNDTASNAFP